MGIGSGVDASEGSGVGMGVRLRDSSFQVFEWVSVQFLLMQAPAQVLECSLVLVLEWAWDQMFAPAPVQGLEWGSAWESFQVFEWVSGVQFVLV